MVWLRRALEILQVTAYASGVRVGQVVIAVHVTLRTLHARVRPGQRKAGRRMVKGCVVPGGGGVTLLAGRGESGLDVVRIGRAVEILHVARSAIGRSAHELSIDVALGAGNVGVCARQWELGKGVVIERRLIPRSCVVARLTSVRKTRLRVRRIVGFVEVRHVAADASRRRRHEFPARVAGVAIQSRMGSAQGKARELQMVELRAHPVVHRVAGLAGGRQIQSDVVNAD